MADDLRADLDAAFAELSGGEQGRRRAARRNPQSEVPSAEPDAPDESITACSSRVWPDAAAEHMAARATEGDRTAAARLTGAPMAKRGTTKRITFEQLASARLGYERDGLTFLQLAQRYGVSESGIRGLLKAVGVTARPPGFAAAFGQEGNLNVVADLLTKALDILPPYEAGLALIAAGLDVLPVARCAGHYREALLQVRAEVDRLLAESAN